MKNIKSFFRLGKVDFTLKNNKGFIWIETLISLSIVILLATTIIPIYMTVQQEKRVLHDRTVISFYLYNELNRVLFEENNDEWTETVNIANRTVELTFEEEMEYVKGCVSWQNVKSRTENLCLYGISQT